MQHDDDFYGALKQHYEYATPDVKEDTVKTPSHYARWAIEPAEFILKNGFEFWRGNIVKYASRAGFKQYDGMDLKDSEILDLRKVVRYAEMRIEQLQDREWT